MKKQIFFQLFIALIAISLVSCKKQNLKPHPTKTIWNGKKTTFVKVPNSDWTNKDNQDRITENVWITRANTKGIFNIKKEDLYNEVTGISPMGTEWAFGNTDKIDCLSFTPWEEAIDYDPPSMVGRDMVLHLIFEDVYLDIKFIDWSIGGTGGGFSYVRSTK